MKYLDIELHHLGINFAFHCKSFHFIDMRPQTLGIHFRQITCVHVTAIPLRLIALMSGSPGFFVYACVKGSIMVAAIVIINRLVLRISQKVQ